MQSLQDFKRFKREKGDTPRIMYARLARIAKESGDAFTEGQLVSLYMSKQDKAIIKIAHPHLLFQFGGRATLAQAFAVVEQLDRGLCMEEAGRLPTSVLGRPTPHANPTSKPKPSPKPPVPGMGAGEVPQPNPTVSCWNYGGDHYQRDCPILGGAQPQAPNGGGRWRGGRRGREGGRGDRVGRGDSQLQPPPASPAKPNANIKCNYASCGRMGHNEAQCWKKFPHLRPWGFTTKGIHPFEAQLATIQASLDKLQASLAQVVPPRVGMDNASASHGHPSTDLFEYGAVAQEVFVAAT